MPLVEPLLVVDSFSSKMPQTVSAHSSTNICTPYLLQGLVENSFTVCPASLSDEIYWITI